VRAFGFEIVQLIGEKRERIRASGSSCHMISSSKLISLIAQLEERNRAA